MSQARVNKLREHLEKDGLTSMFITNDVNRTYLTGFTGTSGYVIITPKRAILLTDFRYREQAPKQAPHFEVIEHGADVYASIQEILKECGEERIGFEQEHVTYEQYEQLKEKVELAQWVPVKNIVSQIRLKKDEEEVAVIREACALADQAYQHVLSYLKPGVREKDIALELEFFMRKHGAASSSFDTIVASGERSSLPHGVASDRVMQLGDLVTLDFGAYYKGYCSDLTRTVMLGEPEAKQREIYDIVLEAQLNVLQHIKPGMTGKEADQLAREIIQDYGYGDNFGHGTGHGIGMEIHEGPRLSPRGEEPLQPGMVVTVEPGIYLPNYGGVRIEDDILITETGIEILTHSEKNFTILG